MIPRLILPEARRNLNQFRAVCVTGPRQSGKTTLSHQLGKGKPYLNFESPHLQFEAENHPDTFFSDLKDGAILDEAQRIPVVFRYLQLMLDQSNKRGQFILTGSNHFLLQDQISQSLAGRAGYLTLLPLSYAELKKGKLQTEEIHHHILTGGYPEIWNESLDPGLWMNSYVQTYVQRDVRLIRNISNLAMFTRFLYLIAGYAGQLVNRDDLARQTGVDAKTILAWLGLLENSYIIFQLQPWYRNLNKRIVRSPKLYFYDTGLLCHLLGIRSVSAVKRNPAYGALFENWIVTELLKNNINSGNQAKMFYFRDNIGNEIDLIIEKDGEASALEIKSAKKINTSMLKGLRFWKKHFPINDAMLIYGGDTQDVLDESTNLIPWHEIGDIN